MRLGEALGKLDGAERSMHSEKPADRHDLNGEPYPSGAGGNIDAARKQPAPAPKNSGAGKSNVRASPTLAPRAPCAADRDRDIWYCALLTVVVNVGSEEWNNDIT
jgi:hypothetical protein